MFRFSEVAVCKKTQIQQIDSRTMASSVQRGDLSILIQVSTGMLLFKMGAFQYGINPNDKLVYQDKDPNYKLMLCLQSTSDKFYILKINDNIQLIYFILSQRCRLINKRASKIIVEQIQNTQTLEKQQALVGANYYKYKDVQIAKEQEKLHSQKQKAPMTTSMLLVDASKSLQKGLIKAGQLLSKGLQIFGGFLARKIEPSENLVVSQQTKKLLKNSTDGSKKLLQITTQKFTGLFRMAKDEAGKLVDKFQTSQKGKKIISEGNYNNYKKKLFTGLHIVANIYDGITQGLSQAGTGLAKGTTHVVGAKYGKDAEEASYQMIEGGRNIYRIVNIPQNVAVKQLKQPEKSQKQEIETKNFDPRKAVIKKL